MAVLNLGVTHGCPQETVWSAGNKSQVICMQGKYPVLYTISPVSKLMKVLLGFKDVSTRARKAVLLAY